MTKAARLLSMKSLVILGTAREESNTLKAIEALCPFPQYELVDLLTLHIHPYQYDAAANLADDFQSVALKMLAADNIIFATPVYWYAMSGTLKVFFDRLTDLLSIHKVIGKGLKGKRTFLIASGSDQELPPGFEVPFKMTAEYFGMNFEKSYYFASYK